MLSFDPRRILVSTDFSSTADHAFSVAQRLASRFGAEIIVVHCDLLIPLEVGYSSGAYLPSLDYGDPSLPQHLQEYADDKFKNGGIEYSVRVLHETPVVGIVRAATEMDADLIVIGTHGRSGWRRAVLGSVAEGVMRATTVPVLTVPRHAAPSIGPILCPVNFSEQARHALEYAASLALALDAELLIAHVLDVQEHLLVDEQRPLSDWIPSEVRSRCRHSEFVVRGDAAEEIGGLAERFDASLIVLGARHQLFQDQSVIGETSERVVRHSTRPVLTIVAPLADAVSAKARQDAAVLLKHDAAAQRATFESDRR